MNLDFEEDLIEKEISINSITKLNKHLKISNEIILCVNIRSLNANFHKLLVFINSLKVKPCIIVCTETWKLEHYTFFKIDDYKMYYNDSNINKSDGVIIYIREDIEETTEIVQINRLKIIQSKIKIDNNQELSISAIYRSHDLYKTEFLMNFKELLHSNKKNKNNLIIGDFNIDILNHDSIDQEFLQTLLEKGYLPGISSITRPSDNNNNNGSCIDNFYLHLNNIKHKSFLLEIPFNDHYPILMQVKKMKKEIKKDTKNNKINYQKLQNIANTLDWQEINQLDDPNIAMNTLIDKIKYCINKAEETNTNKKGNKSKPRKNWITKGIIVSCQTKEKLYNIWKKDPNNDKKKPYTKIM